MRHLALVLAVLAATLAATAARAGLVPHRAFYELALAGDSGDLVAAEGAYAVEWRAHCEGMASRQRLWFVGRLPGGGTLDYDVRFSTFESRDGRNMRFSMRSYQGDALVEEFRGHARMPAAGGAGRATYTVPEGVEMRLPPGTVFPKRHVDRLIRRAEAGDPVATFTLFDGAGVGADALSVVTAAIGEPVPLAADARGERAWPVALAYHPLAEGSTDTPIFELAFELATDGIMREVVLDYGAFALEANLQRLERLDAPSCE
jgi:hypothetical protein